MIHSVAEHTWISFLLRDLVVHLSSPPLLFCDNLSALYMTVNHVFHTRNNHIKIDYHYVREHVTLGLLQTQHVPSTLQLHDIFTKPVEDLALYMLRSKLGILP